MFKLHSKPITLPTQRKRSWKMPHYLMMHFEYTHFIGSSTDDVIAVYKQFYDMAFYLDALLDESAEKTVALRKLLESKDAAVRSILLDINNAERDRALKEMADKMFPGSQGKREEL